MVPRPWGRGKGGVMRGSSWRFGFIGLLVAVTAGAQNDRTAFVHHLLTIPLTGVQGRIDHLAADAHGQRLFVAALDNNTVEVIDLRAGRVANHLTGLREPQGIAFAPETNRL